MKNLTILFVFILLISSCSKDDSSLNETITEDIINNDSDTDSDADTDSDTDTNTSDDNTPENTDDENPITGIWQLFFKTFNGETKHIINELEYDNVGPEFTNSCGIRTTVEFKSDLTFRYLRYESDFFDQYICSEFYYTGEYVFLDESTIELTYFYDDIKYIDNITISNEDNNVVLTTNYSTISGETYDDLIIEKYSQVNEFPIRDEDNSRFLGVWNLISLKSTFSNTEQGGVCTYIETITFNADNSASQTQHNEIIGANSEIICVPTFPFEYTYKIDNSRNAIIQFDNGEQTTGDFKFDGDNHLEIEANGILMILEK